MMSLGLTVSLVEEARGGPFVCWAGLRDAFEVARANQYDAVEIFAPSAAAIDRAELDDCLAQTGLRVAALGTGAGMVLHGWSLSHADPAHRANAVQFVQELVELAAAYDAPAIVGSMQGRWGKGANREETLARLAESLGELADVASGLGQPLLYEPLNRYESNLINTVPEAAAWLEASGLVGVQLLADLFHMNIEEVNLADAIRAAGHRIGHVHFVDSNRRPVGNGHLDLPPIVAALRQVGFEGCLSVEAFPWPDSATAAADSRRAFEQSVLTPSSGQ